MRSGSKDGNASVNLPSPDPSSLSLSCRTSSSSSLDMPDMKSSSESITLVSGVGGAVAAEAILLFNLGLLVSEDAIASAAFLFFGWEEMMSTAEDS